MNEHSFKHGHATRGAPSPEYTAWQNAKARCFRRNGASYARYGGRGIVMCDEWVHDFEAFLRHVGPRPPKHELDRINYNGNYEPGNVRWVTDLEQQRNKSSNVVFEIAGERGTLSYWSAKTGIEQAKLRYRLRHYPQEVALNPTLDLRAGRTCKRKETKCQNAKAVA